MNPKLKIIGLAGTNGSGKDTVGHFLAQKHNYLFISVTDLLRQEAERRSQPASREVLRTISAEWRRESGLGVLIDKALAEYQAAGDKYAGVVISSLRNPGEAERVHELDGTVIWIDADAKIRYDRIQANIASRDRAEEDSKSFEQFQAEEATEMTSAGDEATLSMAGVKDQADIKLDNSSQNIADFELSTQQALFQD